MSKINQSFYSKVVISILCASSVINGRRGKDVQDVWLGWSYLRARWVRAQGVALGGPSRPDELPLNKEKGKRKIGEKNVEIKKPGKREKMERKNGDR